MFRGLTRSLILINMLMLAVPALMMWAEGGQDWLDRLRLMSPFF